jgi:CrcB protein
MINLSTTLYVALGGATGSVLRYLVGLWLPAQNNRIFPWATFTINLAGSLLIGLVLGHLAKQSTPPPHWQALLVTGFCGGFTTLSAMSNEGYLLLRHQQYTTFFLYFAATIGLSLLATALGYLLSK